MVVIVINPIASKGYADLTLTSDISYGLKLLYITQDRGIYSVRVNDGWQAGFFSIDRGSGNRGPLIPTDSPNNKIYNSNLSDIQLELNVYYFDNRIFISELLTGNFIGGIGYYRVFFDNNVMITYLDEYDIVAYTFVSASTGTFEYRALATGKFTGEFREIDTTNLPAMTIMGIRVTIGIGTFTFGASTYTFDGDDTNIQDDNGTYSYQPNRSKGYADLTFNNGDRLRLIYKDPTSGAYNLRVDDVFGVGLFRIESGSGNRGPLIPADSPNNKIYYVNGTSGNLQDSQWNIYHFDNNIYVADELTGNFDDEIGLNYRVLFDNNVMTIIYDEDSSGTDFGAYTFVSASTGTFEHRSPTQGTSAGEFREIDTTNLPVTTLRDTTITIQIIDGDGTIFDSTGSGQLTFGASTFILDGNVNIEDDSGTYLYEPKRSKGYADLTLTSDISYGLKLLYITQDRGIYSARVNNGWQAGFFRIESGSGNRGPLIPADSPNNKIYYVNGTSGNLQDSQWNIYHFDNNIYVADELTGNFDDEIGLNYRVLFDNNVMTIIYDEDSSGTDFGAYTFVSASTGTFEHRSPTQGTSAGEFREIDTTNLPVTTLRDTTITIQIIDGDGTIFDSTGSGQLTFGASTFILDGNVNIEDDSGTYLYEPKRSKGYADLTLTSDISYGLKLLYITQDRGIYSARVNNGWQAGFFRIEIIDTIPSTFSFDATTNVALDATITSNQITIKGINRATTITIDNGWYQIGDKLTSATGSVSANQQVSVQHISANSYDTTTVTTLTIGGVAATFTSRTRVANTQPSLSAFMPVSRTNLDPNQVATANLVISDLETTVTIDIMGDGASYSIGTGQPTSALGMVNNGTITVWLTASDDFEDTTYATITINEATAVFSATTRAANTQPRLSAFMPVSRANLDPNQVASANLIISDLETTVIIDIMGDGALYSIGTDPATNVSGMVHNGTITVWLTASDDFEDTTYATITINEATAVFSATTRAANTQPSLSAFMPVSRANLDPNQVASANLIISDLETTVIIDIMGDGALYSIGTDPATNVSGMVHNGTITVWLTASDDFEDTTYATITINEATAVFSATTRAANTQPSLSAFMPVSRANLDPNQVASANLIISDLETTVIIDIMGDGALYSIGTDPATNVSGMVHNGTITVWLTASDDFEDTTYATITINEATAVFSATTRAQDVTPVFANFISIATETAGVTITSNTQRITDLDYATISIEGGQYRIDNGSFTSVTGNINNNQQVIVRLISGPSGEIRVVTLTIGTESKLFVVTTTNTIDTTPNPFTFDATSNVALNATITSNQITVSDINSATTIIIENGWYQIDNNPPTNTLGFVNANEQVSVRHVSANDYQTTTLTTLTIGTIAATFTSRTRAKDTNPDQFAFTSVTNATPNTLITSIPTTIIGFDDTTISIIGGSYTINNGATTSVASTIIRDSSVVISIESTIIFKDTQIATLTIGNRSATFSVTTGVSLDVDGDLDVDANDGVLIHRVLSGQNPATRNITMPTPSGLVQTPYTFSQVQAIVKSASTTYNVDNSDKVDDLDGLLIRRYLSNAGNITANTIIPAASKTKIIDIINDLMPEYGN